MIRFLSTTVALIWIFPAFLTAQFYITGENPPNIKWNELRTEHYKIIYPRNLAHDASRLGSMLEFALDSVSDLKNPFRKRTPVLMQNGSVLSNGFVTLAPFRMELQVTPPQDLYAQDWIDQLALHEFRHVAQLNQLNQGATRILGWFTGDIARGILSSRFPVWFYEGDAVYNETRLSRSGRGRIAGFEMPLRTLLMQKEDVFSYDKMMFGSFKDFVPDPYIYGYKMTGFLRNAGGLQVWSEALDHQARGPYRILPLAFYLKNNFGFFKQGLYYRTMDSIKRHYNNHLETPNYSKYLRNVPLQRKSYTSYLNPMEWNQSVIAYRRGLDDPGSFVILDSTGNEKILIRAGQLGSGKADMVGSVLVWDEVVTDPRWDKLSYSVIRTYNLDSEKSETLSRKSRYFSPDYSNDGAYIAITETDMENRNFLVVLDGKSGHVISKFNRREVLSDPEWTDSNEVVLITTSERGKQLELLNTLTGQWKILIPHTYNNIADPLSYHNYIIFRADLNGVENLCAFDRESNEIYQVTRSRFGARFHSVSNDRKRLIFSEYSAEGFNISVMDITPGSWARISLPGERDESENSAKNSTIISDSNYKKWAHIFRFHSWVPLYTDLEQLMEEPINADIYPGVMLFSQNLLGTMISSIGYSNQYGYNYVHPSFEWRGWYPVIRFNADIGGPERTLVSSDELDRNGNVPFRLDVKAYLPLSFTRRANTIFITPEAGFEFIPVRHSHEMKINNGISLIHFRFSAANYRRRSIRDLYPPLGQNITATVTIDPDKNIYGTFYSVRTGIFMPGPFSHHHIILNAGFQIQRRFNYLLPYNRIGFPRGYENLLADSYTAISVNYAFPLGYPDLSVSPLFYIKRLRLNLFYDTAYGQNIRIPKTSASYLHSAGGELVTDLHAIRLIFPLSAGIRLGYKSYENKAFAEFLISLDTNLN